MLLTESNSAEFVRSCLPNDCRIERSTVFRGDTPIASVDVNEAGVFVNSMFFAWGLVPEHRVDRLRRWLSQ
jgi:hypothetical protein